MTNAVYQGVVTRVEGHKIRARTSRVRETGWAYSLAAVREPKIGEPVWVLFENGDAAHPIWAPIDSVQDLIDAFAPAVHDHDALYAPATHEHPHSHELPTDVPRKSVHTISAANVTTSVSVVHSRNTRAVNVTVFQTAAPHAEVDHVVEHALDFVTLRFAQDLTQDITVVVIG